MRDKNAGFCHLHRKNVSVTEDDRYQIPHGSCPSLLALSVVPMPWFQLCWDEASLLRAWTTATGEVLNLSDKSNQPCPCLRVLLVKRKRAQWGEKTGNSVLPTRPWLPAYAAFPQQPPPHPRASKVHWLHPYKMSRVAENGLLRHCSSLQSHVQ